MGFHLTVSVNEQSHTWKVTHDNATIISELGNSAPNVLADSIGDAESGVHSVPVFTLAQQLVDMLSQLATDPELHFATFAFQIAKQGSDRFGGKSKVWYHTEQRSLDDGTDIIVFHKLSAGKNYCELYESETELGGEKLLNHSVRDLRTESHVKLSDGSTARIVRTTGRDTLSRELEIMLDFLRTLPGDQTAKVQFG